METAEETDERLMEQVAQGQREPLSHLMRRYANPLLTFVSRMCGDRHRGEELFQEVFLAVWAQSRRYRYPRSFKSWLFGIAANKCKADYRRESRVIVHTGDLDLLSNGADPSPLEASIAAETAQLVEQAVARLPAAQRAVVVMRIYNGLTYSEIAASVERSEDTIRSHMCLALASMRRYLEPRLRI